MIKCGSIGQLAPMFSVFPKRPDCEVFLSIYFVLIFRRMKKDEESVERLASGLNEWVPDLWSPSQPLINVATGVVAPSNMGPKCTISQGPWDESQGGIHFLVTKTSSNEKPTSPSVSDLPPTLIWTALLRLTGHFHRTQTLYIWTL